MRRLRISTHIGEQPGFENIPQKSQMDLLPEGADILFIDCVVVMLKLCGYLPSNIAVDIKDHHRLIARKIKIAEIDRLDLWAFRCLEIHAHGVYILDDRPLTVADIKLFEYIEGIIDRRLFYILLAVCQHLRRPDESPFISHIGKIRLTSVAKAGYQGQTSPSRP